MGELGSSGKKRKKTLIKKAKPDNLEGANSDKKLKKLAKTKKRKSTEKIEAETMDAVDVYNGKNCAAMSDKQMKKKREKEKKKERVRESVQPSNEVEDDSDQKIDNLDGANSSKKMKKVSKNKKRKSTNLPEVEAELTEIVVPGTLHDVNEGKNRVGNSDKKKNKKSKKNKRDKENRKKDGVCDNVSHSNEVDQKTGKSKSASQMKTDATLLVDEDEVYQISSGDEDETTGMKRWITKYHRARPGADVLLENINDFLVDYWAQKEKEKKEKEEEAAEGGWTVVTHIKGRKKTTDAESGTTVGSVAQAAVMDKMSKKKDNQVGLNFYRFQKREAQRNEIMMLQSKFEQDKKRIQQMRAARKFRPY